MNHFIFGIASDHTQVINTMESLAGIGITSDHVSVLAANQQASGELAAEIHAHAAHGSFTGGNIGGGLGWLAGLGALAIPGIGLFVAAGPILGFLTGIAVGRSVGNLHGAMIEEMGIPDAALAEYDVALSAGKIVMSVRCVDPVLRQRVTDLLKDAGLDAIGATPELSPDLTPATVA